MEKKERKLIISSVGCPYKRHKKRPMWSDNYHTYCMCPEPVNCKEGETLKASKQQKRLPGLGMKGTSDLVWGPLGRTAKHGEVSKEEEKCSWGWQWWHISIAPSKSENIEQLCLLVFFFTEGDIFVSRSSAHHASTLVFSGLFAGRQPSTVGRKLSTCNLQFSG